MANYRQIHTKIWKDRWFLDLEPAYKLLFIYLFSNERASISGIYELPKRVIAFEAGVDMETLERGIQVFEKADKAYFRDGVVWVRNLRKYHETKSPKVQTRILFDLDEVRDCELKDAYCQEYGIGIVSESENSVDIPPFKSSIVKSSNESTSGSDPYLRYMPEWIATPPLLNTWGEWQQYQDDKGRSLTEVTAKKQLEQMGKWGIDYSIEVINYSMKQGYTGLIEPWASKNGRKPAPATDPYFDDIKPVGGLY